MRIIFKFLVKNFNNFIHNFKNKTKFNIKKFDLNL
jgi:hypothetical protein